MVRRILIIGGYGVFGGYLAAALAKNADYDVIVAGRDEAKANAFCKVHKARPLVLDVTCDDAHSIIQRQEPFIIIDAAGPFQGYRDNRYKIAHAAIGCGAHYLDLSDDGEFTQQITTLDKLAKAARLVVLSGVSSVPALSSCVVGALKADIHDIHLIETVILPGNRAPRGQSVMKAIIGQAGKPLKIWQGDKWCDVPGWGHSKAYTLTIPGTSDCARRWGSFIGAPDLNLFPEYYKAHSVLFRAGLELKVMHYGLALMSLPVRWRIVKSLLPFVPAMRWLADRLWKFGSDRGGMQVCLIGTDQKENSVGRLWTLIVGEGDGPKIPAIPAQIMVDKIIKNEVPVGARSCLEEFTIEEAQMWLSTLELQTHQSTFSPKSVFPKALGNSFHDLPKELKDLHSVVDVRRWQGTASIVRGDSFFAKIAARVAGFPPAAENIHVEVEMRHEKGQEIWKRSFGKSSFKSYLKSGNDAGSGVIYERFGLFRFQINLKVEDNRLTFPVVAGRFLGIKVPAFLLPQSETFEYVNEQKQACFDVKISLPIAGHVITYQGCLQPVGREINSPS